MQNAHKEFTREEVANAKLKYKNFKTNHPKLYASNRQRFMGMVIDKFAKVKFLKFECKIGLNR